MYTKKITVGGNVENIPPSCFAYCYSVEEIELNEGIKKIGALAFNNLFNPKLTELIIPDSVETICNSAFYMSSYDWLSDGIKKVVLSKNLKDCGISDPNSLNTSEGLSFFSLGNSDSSNNINLTLYGGTFYWNEFGEWGDNCTITIKDGGKYPLLTKDYKLGNSTAFVSYGLVYSIIDERTNGWGGYNCLVNSDGYLEKAATSATLLPPNIKGIVGSALFRAPNITSLNIGKDWDYINFYENMQYITEITVDPDSTEYELYNENLYNCPNKELIFANHNTPLKLDTEKIGSSCTFSDEITELNLPNLIEIGRLPKNLIKYNSDEDGTFIFNKELLKSNSLMGVTNVHKLIIEETASTEYAIFSNGYNDSVKYLEVNNSETSWLDLLGGRYKFNNIETLIWNGSGSIGTNACIRCTSLKSANISGDIEYAAFKECSSLENVVINDGCEKIYSYAFYGCTSLKSIRIPSTVTFECMFNDTNFFTNIPTTGTLYCDETWYNNLNATLKGYLGNLVNWTKIQI